MDDTPFFPPWRARFSRLPAATAALCACTLCALETRFGACVPASLFPKTPGPQNSRERIYTPRRTFWGLLWQALQPGASGREVVRQLQTLFLLHDGPRISPADGAYCRARARLPQSELPKALAATARAAEQRLSGSRALQGRVVKVADGTTVVLPDTPKNRAAYPAVHSAPPNFPLMRLVVLFVLGSGAVLALAEGNLHCSELALLSQLLSHLVKGDIVVGDRAFGGFPAVTLLQALGVDFIGRTTRKLDARRRTKRFGPHDWLMHWEKGAQRSPWLTLAQWAGLPAAMTVRVVRGRVCCKGFRGQQVTVITTLLDPQLYPAAEILGAYLRRWRLEMCLDDLKTTLRMEMLRSRSPAMVRQEAFARMIAHNLVRWTMTQTVGTYGIELERISFKGTVDALRQFGHGMAQARSRRRRAQLWHELLRTLATDLVPERPGRREPRAVKRKKNKYPRLSVPRHRFHDRPKSHARRARARRRKLGLM